MTVKKFFIYLGLSFFLGFGSMFLYHIINRPEPVQNIIDPNVKLKFSFDSLLTEAKINFLLRIKLQSELRDIYTKYDSLIIENLNNGKSKKNALHNLSTSQYIHWKDSVIRANHIN